MLFAGEESGISMDGHPKWRSLWQQLELEVVATIFIIAASSFLFLKLASEIREGETQAVDEAILLALRDSGDPSNPVGPPWVEMMFRDLTSLGSPSVLALVLLLDPVAALCHGNDPDWRRYICGTEERWIGLVIGEILIDATERVLAESGSTTMICGPT
jgi:hypothetical protein